MMFHHVSVGSNAVERAGRFYDAVLKELGYRRITDLSPYTIGYGDDPRQAEFWIGRPHDKAAASGGNGAHIAFNAPDEASVRRFHERALALGGRDAGSPGPRPDYGREYYGAFVYDLDGNKIEAAVRRIPNPRRCSGSSRASEGDCD